MPIPAPQKTLQPDTLRGFLGVNLRRDRTSLADQELARAINADLHQRPGVAIVRRGRQTLTDAAISPSEIRYIAKHNGRRYLVAGNTLFRNQVALTDTLSAFSIATLLPFRPLNDSATWSFVADNSTMLKDDGTVLRNWGIAPPFVAADTAPGVAGSLSGSYNAVYTYARVSGSSIAHESNPSPSGNSQSLSSQVLSVGVTGSTDPQVTNIRIYRTVAGGVTFLFDQQVSNLTQDINSSQADSALGSIVETDNNVPNNFSWAAEFQGHVFGLRDELNPHYLWYSKRFRPESVPSGNFLEIGNPSDPLQAAVPLTGFLGVFSRQTKYRVFGNSTSGFTFLEALSSRGTASAQATIITERGAVFPARDGIWLSNLLRSDEELSQAIEPLFDGQTVNDYPPIDWGRANQMSMASYKGRLYWGYTAVNGSQNMAVLSRDTGQWYFYDHAARSLLVEEDIDTLAMGGFDGIVYVLEDGVTDNGQEVTMTVEPADRFGPSQDIRKLFSQVRFDVDAKRGTVTADILIDGIQVTTKSITGSRRKVLMRLPDRTMGFTWRIIFRYTGQDRAEVHGVQMLSMPLEFA